MGRIHNFEHSSLIPASAEAVFAWHERLGAFERLNAPWNPVRILAREGGISVGAKVSLGVPVGPFYVPWKIEHAEYVQGRKFVDVQRHGPFSQWRHSHLFETITDGETRLRDEIEFGMPFPDGGVGARYVTRELRRLFAYRHATTAHDLAVHSRYSTTPEQTIYLSGASGFIGGALSAFLSGAGHTVFRLTRATPRTTQDVHWIPNEVPAFKTKAPASAVIHLAGEPIFGRRWDEEIKRRIWKSRVDGTRTLCETLAQLTERPHTLICASAIGIYGDRGGEILTEESAAGDGFLAELCRAWEAATTPAKEAGIRVVNVRIGVVLSPQGGALRQMIWPFLSGLGGRLGTGTHYMSWIALDDLLATFEHLLSRGELSGAFNAVSPHPVTNREFTQTLGKVLRRPTLIPIPKKVLDLALGELSDEAIFSSVRVLPKRLLDSQFSFTYPELEAALRHCLGR